LSSELAKRGYRDILVCGKVDDSEGDMMYLAKDKNITPIVMPDLGREISFIKDIKSFMALFLLMRRERPV